MENNPLLNTNTKAMSKELKAQDLRIGNLVWNNAHKEYQTISTIQKNGQISTNDNKYSYSSIECVEPIPLTEDWLVKLGFEKDGVFCDYILKLFDEKMLGYELSHSYLYLAQIYKGQNFREVNLGEFKYLHDLQNLYYALTQTELTLKESESAY